jgi:hypothetical protein
LDIRPQEKPKGMKTNISVRTIEEITCADRDGDTALNLLFLQIKYIFWVY